MVDYQNPTANRWRKPAPWLRVLLAGPVVLIASFIVMAGAGLWVPQGAGGVNHIALPVLLMPGIWAMLFFYAYLDKKLWRAWLVTLLITGLHVALIAMHLQNGGS